MKSARINVIQSKTHGQEKYQVWGLGVLWTLSGKTALTISRDTEDCEPDPYVKGQIDDHSLSEGE